MRGKTYKKSYTFYTNATPKDEELETYLDSKNSKADFIKKLVIDFKEGKLKYDLNENSSLSELQIEKLQADIRIKKATARIKEHYATHLETFGTEPSYQAKEAIKEGAQQIGFRIDRKQKIFSCPKCEQAYRWANAGDLSDKIQKFVTHWYETHHGDPPDSVTFELQQLSQEVRG